MAYISGMIGVGQLQRDLTLRHLAAGLRLHGVNRPLGIRSTHSGLLSIQTDPQSIAEAEMKPVQVGGYHVV